MLSRSLRSAPRVLRASTALIPARGMSFPGIIPPTSRARPLPSDDASAAAPAAGAAASAAAAAAAGRSHRLMEEVHVHVADPAAAAAAAAAATATASAAASTGETVAAAGAAAGILPPIPSTAPTAPVPESALMPVVISGFGSGVIGINDVMFHSSVVVTPAMGYSWMVDNWADVTPESLSFLHLLAPSPEYLILGTGAILRPLPPATHEYLQMLRIPYECMTTHRACGTFNILNEEGRRVVACVLRLNEEEHSKYSKRETNTDKDVEQMGLPKLPPSLAVNPMTGNRVNRDNA